MRGDLLAASYSCVMTYIVDGYMHGAATILASSTSYFESLSTKLLPQVPDWKLFVVSTLRIS